MNLEDPILITGAGGLLGSHLVDCLVSKGYRNVFAVQREDCDLIDSDNVRSFFNLCAPRYVFHCAGRVYGVGGSTNNKSKTFYENVVINTNVIHAAAVTGVKKILVLGSGAVYPSKTIDSDAVESEIFNGPPHSSHEAYAYSKRVALAMLQAYGHDYALSWCYVVATNIYGYRKICEPDLESAPVIEALVYKFLRAQRTGSKIEVWGDGSELRDFLYVKDAAFAIEALMRRCTGTINLGTGNLVSIRQVVELLTEITGVKSRIEWNTARAAGQLRRSYDLSKLKALGFVPKHTLYAGLSEYWRKVTSDMPM